jgi:hypothetical protein
MSVRDKLVELAYVRWELRERAAPAKRPTVVLPAGHVATQPRAAGVRKLALVVADDRLG